MFGDFVSGARNGKATCFPCRVCGRDVCLATNDSGEFGRHFSSESHWFRDVTYRGHMLLPISNRLMDSMTLTDAQLTEYRSRPFVDLSEGYPFPEDLPPKHSKVESRVMTLVSSCC